MNDNNNKQEDKISQLLDDKTLESTCIEDNTTVVRDFLNEECQKSTNSDELEDDDESCDSSLKLNFIDIEKHNDMDENPQSVLLSPSISDKHKKKLLKTLSSLSISTVNSESVLDVGK